MGRDYATGQIKNFNIKSGHTTLYNCIFVIRSFVGSIIMLHVGTINQLFSTIIIMGDVSTHSYCMPSMHSRFQW